MNHSVLKLVFWALPLSVFAHNHGHESLASRWERLESNGPAVTEPAGPAEDWVRLPAEAAPSRMRQIRVEFMNTSQVTAYLREGGDFAILPLGGVAMAGRDAPLGTNEFINHATAVLLGERWNALVFPPIPYTYAGGAQHWPGTISISEEETFAYARHVINDLFEGGFKRVVLLVDRSIHAEAVNFVRSIHRERGDLVLAGAVDLLPATDEITQELGTEPADDIRAMAALRILGHPEVFTAEQASSNPGERPQPLAGAEALRRLNIKLPPIFTSPEDRLVVRGDITEAQIDKAIELMRATAKRYDIVAPAYERYSEFLAEQIRRDPGSLENYVQTVQESINDKIERGDFPPPQVQERDNADIYIPREIFATEALPENKRRYRVEFMSAADIAQRIRDDAVAILPVGAFEMHGPHAPLATDTIQAHSTCVVMANEWENAVVFPPINYVYAGASEIWAGTVSTPPEPAIEYVQSVLEGIFDMGFRRVVLSWFHGPGGGMSAHIVADIYHERGDIVFNRNFRLLPDDLMEQRLGYGQGEDIRAFAGLKVLGFPGLFVVDEPQDVGVIKLPHPSLHSLFQAGFRGVWFMETPSQHLAVRSSIKTGHDDIAIEIMRQAAREFQDLPQAMSDYLEGVESLQSDPPWALENWEE